MYNTTKAGEAQKKFCSERKYPEFAPTRTGHCYRCGRDIFQLVKWPDGHTSGITVERAASEFITGCPHCHYSFCD